MGSASLNLWDLPAGDTKAGCVLKIVFRSGRRFGLFRSERTRGFETTFLQLVICCPIQAMFCPYSTASGPRVTGDTAAGLASKSKLIQFPPWEKCKWWTKCKGSTSHDNIISQVSHVQASPGFPEFWNHVVLSFQKDVLLCPNKLTYAFLPVISAVKLAQNGLSDGIAIGRLLWPDWPVGTY